jgi:hypothetical protein
MEQARKRRGWPLTIAVAFLGGCAGNGSGLDQSGRPVAGPGGGGGVLTADFSSIQSHILTPICTACHAGGGSPQGLRLDAKNSYSLLVGVPSSEVSAVLRVKAGDPNNSYLIQKLEGHAAIGARMPFGGPYLDQSTIDVIRQWISDGALQGAPTANAPFAVSSLSAMGQDVLPDGRARLIVGFTEELDQSRLDRGSVRLERLYSTAGETGDDVEVELSVPHGNARALMVVTRALLREGRYRLTVPVAPATGLSGISGRRLVGPGDPAGPLVLSEFEFPEQP